MIGGTIPTEQRPDDFRRVINRAKENVFPAVVYLRCVVENFEMGKRLRHGISGSGVVISADGEVVTNWHVVENALEVRCLLNDGRAFDAEVVGSDKDTDIALVRLKLPAGEKVPFAVLTDESPLQEGDFVMALGAPWGLNRSVSFGIVACARRYLPEGSEYSTWIQTDASISPGNSGGPLVDTSGRVVGINTRGAMQGGDMGFAVPAGIVKLVVPRLRAAGTAGWAWTGLQLQPLRDFQRNITFPGDSGVIVAGTDADSPAREAGLKPHDRLLAVAGQPITALMEEDLPEVRRRLALLPVGTPVPLKITRDGTELTLSLTSRAKGKVLGEELSCPRWDFTVKQVNQFEVPDLHFQLPAGLYVRGVRSPGNADGSGLRPRDLLLRINGIPVSRIEDVRKLHEESLAKLRDGGPRRLVLAVLRNGQDMQIVVDISRDYANP
ncbi:MAG: trypsin-like peptidase domain-containing protein [Opitutaceae bacterium]